MAKPSHILGTAAVVLGLIFGPLLVGRQRATPSDKPGLTSTVSEHVIMISIDGMVPDYYTAPEQVGLRAPNLAMMRERGSSADGVEGVYPSVTYPSHTTMVTGVHPARHGIVQNRVFEAPTEPQTGSWYWFADALKSETLWMLARKAGLKTAAVGWPVTVKAEIDYNFPEIWDPAEKPITSKRAVPYTTPGLLEKARRDSSLEKETSTDGRRTAISEFIINEYKPSLMLIHLVELDEAHHKFGPRTPEALAVAEHEDGYLGRILEATRRAGIFDKTTFFIVSDHGFMAINKRFEPNVLLVREKLITLDANNKPVAWKAAVWEAGGSAAIILRNAQDKETAAKVASIFKKETAKGGPLFQVLTRKELDRLGAIPSAALMLEAAQGYSFGGKFIGPEVHDSDADYRGTHGYLPTRPEMRSSLIIYGAGAREGSKVTLARMIDIAPTAAALLGLKFSSAEGSPKVELLK